MCDKVNMAKCQFQDLGDGCVGAPSTILPIVRMFEISYEKSAPSLEQIQCKQTRGERRTEEPRNSVTRCATHASEFCPS